jgi:CheY-like chemotaxis protein
VAAVSSSAGGSSTVDEPARILLVDDRPENLLALEAILDSLGQTLVRANSGEEALKALLADDFAVILLDVQMPGMDGFETAAHIKRRERTRDIPIIFLTAINREPQHAFRGYSAGAVDYLAKPFDPWVLRAKVSVFVDLHRKNRQLREQAALLAGQVAGLGDPEVVDDVARHLAVVEEQLANVVRATAPEGLPELAGLAAAVAALRQRVDSLRADRV